MRYMITRLLYIQSSLLPLLCLVLLAGSCSGGESGDSPAAIAALQPLTAHDGITLPQEDPGSFGAVPGLPEADPLAQVDRNLSFTNIVSYNGNGIFDSSPQNLYPNNTTVLPSSLTESAWARYAFNTGGYQPERLSVDLVCNPGSVAYVGYSDYGSGHWHWEQPTDGPASYDLLPGLYLNGTGQFFVVVLTAGGSAATVRSLSVRFDNDVIYGHSISGTVLDEHGDPLASQSVSVTPNPDFVNVVTDVDGTYIIGLPSAGMYSVEPQSMNVAYSPPSEMVDVNGTMAGIDFTGTRIDIRGRIANADGIGLPGVSLTLNPGAIATTVSGADGEYEFQAVADGAYSVEPLLATYTFSPLTANASVSGADEEDVNFEYTGGQPTFGIFGNIHEANLDPVPGVFVTLTPGNRLAQTDANGNYGFTNLAPATFELKPNLGNWSFAPVVKQVNISGASENGADFTGTPPPPSFKVSGEILWQDTMGAFGIPFVTAEVREKTGTKPVLYTGFSDQAGSYEIHGVPAGSYWMTVKGFGYDSGILHSLDVVDQDVTLELESALVGGPTWQNFASSYVGNHCTSCHRPDSQTSVSPFLRDYTETKNAGSACNFRIQNDTMPPGNPSLAIHKRYFEKWKEAGYPLN